MGVLKLYLLLLSILGWASVSNAGLYNVGMFWTIADKIDPICNITTSISGWRTSSTETVNFSCTDNTGLKAVECSVNGGAWVNCSSWTSHTISGLTSGSSTSLQIRAFDVYGRVSAVGTAQTRNWSTDATAPTISIGTISGTNTGAPSIAFSGGDAHSGIASYQCSYDTGTANWVSCTSPRAGSTGGAGVTYYFRVRSFDVAGNASGVAQTSWTNGNWGGFGGCNKACGGGVQTRYCNNPSPSASPAGMGCAGSATQSCNNHACCVGGNNTTNMCPGNTFYLYRLTGCGGCPGAHTNGPDASNPGDPFICYDTPCSAAIPSATVSCANGSASVASDGGCASKGGMSTFTCQCN